MLEVLGQYSAREGNRLGQQFRRQAFVCPGHGDEHCVAYGWAYVRKRATQPSGHAARLGLLENRR